VIATTRVALVLALALALTPLYGCNESPDPAARGGTVVVSVLAVGDTGRPHRSLPSLFEGQVAVAEGMVAEDRRSPVDALVLLGDNFYDNGLQPDTMVERIRENVTYPYCRFAGFEGPRSALVAPACTLEEEARHPIPIYAVMGNHDIDSTESKRMQCEEVPDFVSNWYMPCSYAEVIEIPGGVSLILFDSEQFAHPPEMQELMLTIRSSKGPWRVLAAHRPVSLDRNDRHMGQGFVHDAVRVSGVPVHAYLSGHNHSLQLLVEDKNGPPLQAIVGSGSRARPPIEFDAPSRRFGASRLGFARVDVVERDGDQRLVLSIFQTPDLPILSWGHPKLVAQWSIGHNLEPRNELASESPVTTQ
jgi:hypothetical protein